MIRRRLHIGGNSANEQKKICTKNASVKHSKSKIEVNSLSVKEKRGKKSNGKKQTTNQ